MKRETRFGALAIASLLGVGCAASNHAKSADGGADATTGSAITCATDAECASQVPATTPANCATGACDALQGVCVFSAKDEDGDGFPAAACVAIGGRVAIVDGEDCNDLDKNLYPGHPEPCTYPEDAGAPPAGYCAGQVSCLANGTESACTGTITCSSVEVCAGGTTCSQGCEIAGMFVAPGTNPNDPCESCAPGTSTAAWTDEPDGTTCGNGQVCGGGQCGTQCDVGGILVPSGAMNPTNPCQTCQPAESTRAWTELADGTPCGPSGAAAVCTEGNCESGCYVQGVYDPAGTADGTNTCETCQPNVSTTGWTPAADGTSCDGDGQCCGGGCLVDLECNDHALAMGQNHPIGIAVDATSVYWTDMGGGAVMKLPLDGGTPTTLASGQDSPYGIVVDATSVYWTNYNDPGTVMQLPLDGGAPTTLASGQDNPYGIAVDATSVYWTNYSSSGEVMKVGIGGGPLTMLAGNQTAPTGIAVDATSVYWTGLGVTKVALGGGPLTMLAGGDTTGIAVDATSVYWTAGGAVMKVALGGGTPTTLAAGGNSPGFVTVDATSVYWTDSLAGTVMQVALGGGTVTTLVSGQAQPNGIAVDPTSVYWTGLGSGTVNKAPK